MWKNWFRWSIFEEKIGRAWQKGAESERSQCSGYNFMRIVLPNLGLNIGCDSVEEGLWQKKLEFAREVF